MRGRASLVLLLCLLAGGGCSKTKTTDQLLEDLKGPDDRDRLIAVRLLPQRRDAAAQIIPALIVALKDKESDIRASAAIGLGTFGESAKDAIPGLQTAQRDRDARVREAAGKALFRIDPQNFSDPAKAKKKAGSP